MLGIMLILTLALLYGYLNGVNGSASIVATVVTSRALSPRMALALAGAGICAGPLFLGVAVANTIGAELVGVQAITVPVVVAGLAGAILWSSFTVWSKIPTSISQSLIGGLIGAAWAGFGHQAILPQGLSKVLVGLFLSPVLGIVAGFLLVRLCYWMVASLPPSRINHWFNRGQVFLSFLVAMAFGANDGQKIMGIVTLGLVATGTLQSFAVPLWVAVFSALAISLGAMIGGLRLINTLGNKVYRVRPVHGFGAQMSSATVILSAAVLGGPVSGSHVVTSAIVGAGSADRVSMIRWGMVQRILVSWFLTLPASAVAGAVTYTSLLWLL